MEKKVVLERRLRNVKGEIEKMKDAQSRDAGSLHTLQGNLIESVPFDDP